MYEVWVEHEGEWKRLAWDLPRKKAMGLVLWGLTKGVKGEIRPM
jgi:hypothetical protein